MAQPMIDINKEHDLLQRFLDMEEELTLFACNIMAKGTFVMYMAFNETAAISILDSTKECCPNCVKGVAEARKTAKRWADEI